MKVAFYTDSFDPSRGGMERVTHILSNHLKKLGVELYGICVYDLPVDKNLYSQYVSVIQADGNGDNPCIDSIVEFIRQNKIDIFVNQVFVSFATLTMQRKIKDFTSAILINAKHTTPLLLNSIDNFDRAMPLPQWLGKLFFRVYKRLVLKPKYINGERDSYIMADKTVLLAQSNIAEFLEYNHIADPNKLCVINNPIECDTSANYPCDTSEKKDVMLVVSRMSNTQKRIDRALLFWKYFAQKHPDWELKIVGDGKDLNMLKGIAHNLELERYSFEGASSNPYGYYREAKIFLMTSSFEGWGMTIVEAMTQGCVPIAMDSFSALHDIITNGENGEIVPENNYTAMCYAAEKIINNFDAYSTNTFNSTGRFSVDKIGNDWVNLFKTLLINKKL